jgi:hypothetical protein
MKKNISIDISSKTLDICIKENGSYTFHKIENNVKSIQSFFLQVRFTKHCNLNGKYGAIQLEFV